MSNQHFTHLHLHTEFSLLDGAIRISDLVKFAKEQTWQAVGISDHGNVFGAVKFFELARKEKIKPILGCEMYLTQDARIKDPQEKYFHIILIVQNEIGYRNLCKLMAFAYQQGFYFKPRIDYAILQKHSEGLIISTGCIGGHIPTLLRNGQIAQAEERTEWFLQHFGKDRFYIEIMPPDFEKQIIANELLINHAKKFDLNLLATSDAHYMDEKDQEAHEVMLAIQTKDVMSNPDRYTFGGAQCFLRTTDQMLAAFPNNPEAVWNSGRIADSCDFDFVFGKLFFPKYPIPQEHTENSYFEKLCLDGLERLKQEDLIPADQHKIYDHRLKTEIDLICTMGFVGYFLVVSDFIQWGKTQDIPIGPGRGSAAGSLVAWSLQITNIDPIQYNLLFERFLNPERVSMPDIDIDFCVERREEVINYVKDKYGHDSVCQIITFGTMMAKGVIKDVSRALGFPFQDANALTDLVGDQLKITLNEALELEPRLKDMMENPKVKHLMEICFKLEGLTRHASKHAAGVVISPGPLDEMLPLYIPPKTNELVTQYAMTELEHLGFLKMDFLGLKNLTVIDRTCKALEKNLGIKINLDKIPMDDAATLKLLCQGKTSGVFQFEGSGVTDVLVKLQPDKFEDLIAVNALYRPGPLGSGMVQDFIDRRHGTKKTTYMFPQLESILSETYGVIVYQEQVIKIASTIAGYSLGAADILRRAMGKKKADVMAEQKELFVQGAIKNGFNAQKSGELFDLMAFFAGYGFNKSHSAAYALIAYHTAYLKAHYMPYFMASLISFETTDPEKFSYYLQSTKELGLKVLPPDINRSQIEFTVAPAEDGSLGILFGLQGIKNVGGAALATILEEQNKKPFSDLYDFCKRVDLRTVNKRVIESMIYAGCMDKLPGNRAQKMAELEQIMGQAQQAKDAARTGQMTLFSFGAKVGNDENFVYTFQPLEDWSMKEKLDGEKMVAGFYLHAHPLDNYRSLSSWIESTPFATALATNLTAESLEEPTIIAVGLLKSFKVITTKKGSKMAFGEMEDFSGPAELIIFPKIFEKVERHLKGDGIYVIKGVVDMASTQKCKIKVNEMILAETFLKDFKGVTNITIKLPSGLDEATCVALKEKLYQGGTTLQFMFTENNQTFKLTSQQRIACHTESFLHAESLGAQVLLKL